jgi:hypothetical protein
MGPHIFHARRGPTPGAAALAFALAAAQGYHALPSRTLRILTRSIVCFSQLVYGQILGLGVQQVKEGRSAQTSAPRSVAGVGPRAIDRGAPRTRQIIAARNIA